MQLDPPVLEGVSLSSAPPECKQINFAPSVNAATALRKELAEAGVFTHRTLATLGKFCVLLAVTLSLWMLGLVAPTWAALLLALFASVPLVSAAMCGHEAGHNSFAAERWKNNLMLHAAFPLLTGLGVQHWKHKHNVLHHGHPNIVGQDDDIALWPMAMCEQNYLESPRAQQWFQRHLQGFMFWPLTLLLSFVMRWETCKGSWRYVRTRGVDRALLADLGCQAMHYVLFLVLPALAVGFWRAALFYTAVWAVAGLLLVLIFIPAHVGLPFTAVDEKGWEHQVASSRNFLMPGWLSWLFVGLDSQVEHHLFPRITHQNLRAARPIVRRYCEAQKLEYREIPYLDALRDSSRYLFRAWRTPAAVPGEREAPN